jgi:cytochrome c oxidase cbb3-type subunit 3
MNRVGCRAVLLLVPLAVALGGCEREQRLLQTPPTPISGVQNTSSFTPGPTAASVPQPNTGTAPAYTEDNAWVIAQGKRWFRWYNCSGCHSAGGGGMGPALMDTDWLYGSRPDEITRSILLGRPNGMPSFAGRIPPDQVAQIVAYVRSMGGQLRVDVAGGRSDSLSPGSEPESRREYEPRTAPK